MWKKILVSGAVGAAILGAGGVALASTGASSPTPPPSTSASGSASGPASAKHHGRDALRDAVRGQIVTKGKDGSFVTHDAIRGVVTAVNVGTGSITVQAADKSSETFVVTSTTLVHTKAEGKSKGTTGALGSVEMGDKVGVLGTGTGPFTATHIVDASR